MKMRGKGMKGPFSFRNDKSDVPTRTPIRRPLPYLGRHTWSLLAPCHPCASTREVLWRPGELRCTENGKRTQYQLSLHCFDA